MAATGVFGLTRFTALASGDVIPAVDISDSTQSAHGSLDAMTVVNFFATIPVPVIVTSASANALAVGLTGNTNSAFKVDASTALQVAGLKVVGAVTTGTVAIVVTDSGAVNTNLSINALGAGTIGIGSVSTGRVTITPVTTITGALTLSAALTYGGVALSNAVTGTGNMVLSASPTLTGTITVTGATITGLTAASVATGTFPGVYTVTGALTLSAALTYGGVTLSNAVTGTGNMVLSAGPTFTGTVATANISATGTVVAQKAGGTSYDLTDSTSSKTWRWQNSGTGMALSETGVADRLVIAAGGAVTFAGSLAGITTMSVGSTTTLGLTDGSVATWTAAGSTKRTIANNGVFDTAGNYGMLLITHPTGYTALFVYSAVGPAITKVADPSAQFSTTLDNVSTTNVYWSGGALRVQNKTGSSANYTLLQWQTL